MSEAETLAVWSQNYAASKYREMQFWLEPRWAYDQDDCDKIARACQEVSEACYSTAREQADIALNPVSCR